MRVCRYSGNVCRAEELVRQKNPEMADQLVKEFCNGKKENCSQYRFIEDSGIGFGYDLSRWVDSSSELLKRIRKGSDSNVN